MARCAPTGKCRDLEGEVVQRIFRDALKEVPMPAPWKARAIENGKQCYINQTSGETRWEHPLASQVKELEPVILCILVLAPAARAEAGAALSRRWQWEAEVEYKKWYAVEDSNSGMEYYCNRDTDETMWEHPHEALLPAFFLKIRCAQRLTDQDYLASLGLYASKASRSRQGQLHLKRFVLSLRCRMLYCFTQLRIATKWLLQSFAFTFHFLCNSCRVCSCSLGSASQTHRKQQGRRCKTDAEGMAERLVGHGKLSDMLHEASTQAFYIGDDEDDSDDDCNEAGGDDGLRDGALESRDSTEQMAKPSRPLSQDKLEHAMKMAERAALDASFKRETSKFKVRSCEGPITDRPPTEKVAPFRPGQGGLRAPRKLLSGEILAYRDGLPSEEPMVPCSPQTPSRRSRSIAGAVQKMSPQAVPMAELMAYADGLPSRN